MFLVRKHIEIDAGHRVPYHGSKCRNIHGHRYRVTVVVGSEYLIDAELEDAESGMVTDFGVIKKILMELVHDKCDHKLLLWEGDPLARAWLVEYGLVLLPCIPTAEELARYWGEQIQQAWKDDNRLTLIAVEVMETPTSFAIWRP